MGYKRKYGAFKKTNKKTSFRRYKKRRLMRRQKRSIYSLPLAGFPKAKLVRLRYAEEIVIDAASAGPQRHVFSANGLYDPNITGVGHQPKGFDQNMIFYNHYCVLGSKITMKYASKTGANAVPGYVNILLTDDGITSATWTQPYEFYESRYNDGKIAFAGTERGYLGQPNIWKKKFSAKKFFRRKPNTDEALRGSTAANPPEQAYYECIVCPIGTNDPAPLTFMVIIDYIALLTEPNDIPTS